MLARYASMSEREACTVSLVPIVTLRRHKACGSKMLCSTDETEQPRCGVGIE